MPVPNQNLFLDPEKHPYVVMSGSGRVLARFSNLPCAAQTVAKKHKRLPGTVLTPEGHVIDKKQCQAIVESKKTMADFVAGMGVANGSR